MAKASGGFSSSSYKGGNNIKRKGIHAKSKHSNHKHSKNYVKAYRGQGR